MILQLPAENTDSKGNIKMKKDKKNIIRIIGTGVITIAICLVLLFVSSMIPQKLIKENSVKSADYYSSQELFVTKVDTFFFSRQDNYADCILSNIIYHIDSKHPVISSLRASYYQPELENVDVSFAEAVEKTVIPNVDYYRYWHGSMVLLRPLLMITDIIGVRLILGVLAIMLSVTAAILLWKQKEKALAVIYLVSLCLVDVWMICFCIEYVTTFLIMGTGAIFLIQKAGKIKENTKTGMQFLPLFLSIGIVTAFMDFLTTETITCTIPLLILMVMLYHQNKIQNIKEAMGIMLKNGIAWVTGYGVMFLLKWILSAAFFGTTALKKSFAQAALRMGGDVNLGVTNLSPTATFSQRLAGAIWHNLGCLFHFKDRMNGGITILITGIILFVVFCLVYLFHVGKISKTLYVPLGLLALLPYVRYFVLSNHAYLHYFFTYRAQLVTVMIILMFTWENAITGIIKLCQKGKK